uniref:protein NLP7-like n=1 Tax=Erigeron canadensis TaxID=72917 RepID=UPI001CB9389A|nr:protein NLP7-like [Erigeron canadensis]
MAEIYFYFIVPIIDQKAKSSSSGSDMALIKDLLEPSAHQFAGESKYLTSLLVSRNREPSEPLSRSDSSQSPIPGFEPRDKIYSGLKLPTFREEHVLVQFWTTDHISRKCQTMLTTMNQPFGLGVADERLCQYRKYSERNPFTISKDREEQDPSPIARVFRRGEPEWTPDVTNYNPKDFPSLDCAIRCNLHGYLALPVFESTTGLCIGVLELLLSSRYTSFAYEVRQIHMALKTVDLTTTQALDRPTTKVQKKHWRNDLEKILSILKVMCAIHKLPLAQTWTVSPFSSMACQKQILKKICNSFDTTCLGRKVCMSTSALPFHVQDLGMWPFWKACREQHLNQYGLIGRTLLSRGSCFCLDVTKLSEEEYPLVRNASMSKLTSCFAIFLHVVESNSDYVLEFFLPSNIKDGKYVLNLMQTLKQNSDVASGFEWGDELSIEVGASAEVSSVSLSKDLQSIQLSPMATTKAKIFEMLSSDSESNLENVTKTVSTNVMNQFSLRQKGPGNCGSMKMSDTITDGETNANRLKQIRKRKTESLTLVAVQKHNEIPIGEASTSLNDKSVSQSTSKRFCREDDITHGPFPKLRNKSSADVPDIQRSSNIRFSISVVVLLLVRVKRWSCARKCHGFSGKWWRCGKHRCIPCISDFIYHAACLMVRLKRWRNKNLIRHAMNKRNHPDVHQSTEKPRVEVNMINPYIHVDRPLSESTLAHASLKHTLANVSDTRMVTVKATFNKDMIKFPFRTSLGLLELKNNVAQRIKLNSKKLRLKYKDEDDDMILIACDTDLHHLLGFLGANSTIKIFILVTDD